MADLMLAIVEALAFYGSERAYERSVTIDESDPARKRLSREPVLRDRGQWARDVLARIEAES